MPGSYTRQGGWDAVKYVSHPCLDEGMGHLAQVAHLVPRRLLISATSDSALRRVLKLKMAGQRGQMGWAGTPLGNSSPT